MALMPNIEAEALAAVRRGEHLVEGLFHRAADAASQTPAPGPVTLAAAPPTEDDMSLLTELKSDAKALAAKFESLDEALLAKMEAVQANPGLMALIDAGLAAAHVPPTAYGVVTGGLAELEKLYAPQQAEQAQDAPAGPQVAGQA